MIQGYRSTLVVNRCVTSLGSNFQRLNLQGTSIFSHDVTRQYHWSLPRFKIIVENVPALGESITEGSIGKWLKQPGDKVSKPSVFVFSGRKSIPMELIVDNYRLPSTMLSSLWKKIKSQLISSQYTMAY
jgi:hypothetical protein